MLVYQRVSHTSHAGSTGSTGGSTSQESFQRDSAVVIVLDRFEHFCGMARQTLLYNLFNLAQDLSDVALV
jgi:Cdc6-like AAA superfamily ATPase